MNWKACLTGVVASAALVGAASAGTVDVTAYNGYDDNGAGMTFLGSSVATGTISSASTGFFYNWNSPGSIGGFNAADAFSADFTGTLYAASAGTYTFNFGSDDAAYLFINGVLAISDGNAHSYNPADYSVALNAGANSFEIQYGNLFCCGADVGLTVGPGVSVVPEPATWAMMLIGFGGLGAMMRSQRDKRAMA